MIVSSNWIGEGNLRDNEIRHTALVNKKELKIGSTLDSTIMSKGIHASEMV